MGRGRKGQTESVKTSLVLLKAVKRELVATLVHVFDNLLERILRRLAYDGHCNEGIAIDARRVPILAEPLGKHCVLVNMRRKCSREGEK